MGAIYAKILVFLVPAISEQMAAPPAYAMVGMAAVLASSFRAPLTTILMLFV
ncbi:chloride channel protein [Halotia wernerae UHCC 0503]|nr:chloride channel protein [Halotia wernerae UHCC 0503]